MSNINKKQSIAVFVSIGFLVYLLFGDAVIDFFNSKPQAELDNVQQMQANTSVISQDLVTGEGDTAAVGDMLTVHYVGRLEDGRVFDSSVDRNLPFDFTLGVGQVIRGWDEGLAGMRAGGKRTLVISPDYAYGPQAVGAIPPNSTLIFEVELLDVQKP